MNLKNFLNMMIAALVVFIVFNLFVPMSVTVVNEGFTEQPDAEGGNEEKKEKEVPPPSAESQ